MAPFFLAAAALWVALFFPAAGAGGADLDPAAITDLYAHSLEAVRECERRSPGNSKSLYDTGLVHRRFGYDDRAIEAFRECLKKDPAHPARGLLLYIGPIRSLILP